MILTENILQQNDQLKLDTLRKDIKGLLFLRVPEIRILNYSEDQDYAVFPFGHDSIRNKTKRYLLLQENLRSHLEANEQMMMLSLRWKLTDKSLMFSNLQSQNMDIKIMLDYLEKIFTIIESADRNLYFYNIPELEKIENQLNFYISIYESGSFGISGIKRTDSIQEFVIQFVELASKRIKNLIKHFVRRISICLKRDIRQGFRNILQLLFKNMDDNSGAEIIFSTSGKQLFLNAINYHQHATGFRIQKIYFQNT